MASGSTSTASGADLRSETADGLIYAHARLSEGSKQTLQASSFLYALVELLEEKGLLSIEELDARQQQVAARLKDKNDARGIGVVLQDPEFDKYAFEQEIEIDCANRVALCKAACCRLPFALSKQDIREGQLQWDFGQPYLISQNAQGYCVHLEAGGCRCTVHAARPVPCRAFDCRTDKRIWLDFERRLVNPDIERETWPQDIDPGGAGDAP